MVNILQGIVAALIAAAIVFVFGAFFSGTARRILTVAASELLGIDVNYVFASGKAAEGTVTRELASASTVDIFAGRGNDFQGTLYAPLLEPGKKSARRVRVLLPNPYGSPRGTDWIDYRDAELARVDASYGKGQVKRQIQTSVEHIEHHVDGERFQVRLYDMPHVGRIILTERYVFFTPYSDTKHGRDCRVFQCGRGDIYDCCARFFDMAWIDSTELTAARGQTQQVSD